MSLDEKKTFVKDPGVHHKMWPRHHGSRSQRIQLPPEKLSVHLGSYPSQNLPGNDLVCWLEFHFFVVLVIALKDPI